MAGLRGHVRRARALEWPRQHRRARRERSAGGIEGLTLRLYNAEARQWNITWANGRDGALDRATMYGSFAGGRGEFFGQDQLNGRAIYVRFVFSDITATAFRFEQAFSPDFGRTWEVNWKAVFTR